MLFIYSFNKYLVRIHSVVSIITYVFSVGKLITIHCRILTLKYMVVLGSYFTPKILFSFKTKCRALFGVLPGYHCDCRQYAWLVVWLNLNQLILGSMFSFLISWVCRKSTAQCDQREEREREIQSLSGSHGQGIRCRWCGAQLALS